MDTTEAARAPAQANQPLWKRLGWLVLIWAASVTTMFVLSAMLRLWLRPLGP